MPAQQLGYTQDQINKIGNGGSLEVPSTLSSASLASVPSLNTPPKPQDPTNYAGIMNSLTPYLTQAYAPTQADQQNSDVQNELTGLYGTITGQGGSVGSGGQIDTKGAMGGALDTAAQSLGYASNPALLNQLTDANNQLRSLQLEAQSIPLQLQQQAAGRGITEGGLQPLQTAALRNNAIRALGVASIAQTLQGNVARAQDMAQKAVDAQFQPLQTKLNYLQNIYQLNKDTLERQDKRRADMLKLTLEERTRVLNNQREDYKTALAAMADAVAKNPGNQQAALAAQQAQQLDPTDPQYLLKVRALVAPFASDLSQRALDQQLKRAQIASENLGMQKTRADIEYTEAQKKKLLAELPQAQNAKAQLQNNEALSLALQLRKDDAIGKGSAVGASVAKFIPYGQSLGLQGDRTAFEAKVDSLKANLTLDNLKLLKGAMSDKDLLFLNSIGSSLNTNMSEEQFNNELDRIINKLQSAGATDGSTSNGTTHTEPDGTTWVVKNGRWVQQ